MAPDADGAHRCLGGAELGAQGGAGAQIDALRAQGLAACWATLETAQGFDEVERAEPLWLSALHRSARPLPDHQRAPDPAPFIAGPVGFGRHLHRVSLNVVWLIVFNERTDRKWQDRL